MAQLLRDAVELTESQQLVRSSVRNVCSDYDAEYWRRHAAEGEYPHEFVDALVDHGWMGILLPEDL
ncbi:acyl-CoA dehydrogenase family protein [Natrinema sp. H-ect4]|jgi:acyl-CoA dehydrogenase|uniref:acyl-CoA dehydrogenase family protein n=1 Tax=Natrinema sp. H-ect4 TaxID=3242699 RepID=UPI0035A87CB3